MTARLKFPPPDAFRALWQEMPPDAVVAQDWSYDDCPIAKGITILIGIVQPTVLPYCYCMPSWNNGASRDKLPKWAAKFARYVDKEFCGKGITAAQCLAVLDAIEGRGS